MEDDRTIGQNSTPPNPSPETNQTNLPIPPSADLFDPTRLKFFRDGDLTINDYNLKNALLFSQGSWSLIRRDLTLAGIDPTNISSLEDENSVYGTGPCADLINAFRVRKELIHYKKLCLHVFSEARRIEHELKQAMAFFFWFDGDDPVNGNRVHLEAICESHEPSLLSLSSGTSSKSAEQTKDRIEVVLLEAASRHADPTSCTLLDRKRLYVLASKAWMYHRGISRAVQDARDVAKAICMSPRHPDGEANGERPLKLRDLPGSMYVKQACDTAARDDPRLSRGERKRREGAGSCGGDGNVADGGSDADQNRDKSQASTDNGTYSGDASRNKETESKPQGHNALHKILLDVRTKLFWPPEAVEFLCKSIIARGGFKALAIVEELQHYHKHLSRLPNEIETVLEQYVAAQSEMVQQLSKSKSEFESKRCIAKGEVEFGNEADIGSAAVNRHRHIHQLKGALDACKENAKWVTILNQMATVYKSTNNDNSNGTYPSNTITKERLFAASDDLSSSCAFAPTDFILGNFVAESRRNLDTFLLPAMRTALTVESWPPKAGSRRTRVLAFDESTIGDAVVKRKKLHHCTSCDGMFDSRWIRLGLCSICEDLRRRERWETTVTTGGGDPCCIFEHCKFRYEAYCPHSGRCFVCDAPYSCENLCRLSRGNGEVATTLVETLQPQLLLIDFDRTLCSTKSGASPLPSSRQHKDGYAHTIDPDLRIAIAAQRLYGTCYVVTRNSHLNEIKTFLKMHGMEDLANNVCVVPKKKAKGIFIREHFFGHQESNVSNEIGRTCLFIDDDIRELVSDPWMKNNEQIHRLLFTRAFHK